MPAGRIYSVADIVADPHYLARGMILDADLPGGASVKMPGIVPKMSDTPGNVNWQGPSLGQHTRAVLGELGLSEETIQRLKDGGGAMITDYSQRLIIQEVSPRDGLQIEPVWVETADKINLINELSLCGFSRIEAGSLSPQSHSSLARRGASVPGHQASC